MDDDEMKIAYLSSAAIPSTSAHSLQVMKMCQAMTQEGHAVTLLLPPSERMPERGELERTYGVTADFEIRRVGLLPILGRRGLAMAEAAEAVRLAPDLAYARGVDIAWAACLRGLYTVLEIHHPPTGRLGPLYLRWLAHPGPGSGWTSARMLVISRRLEEILREKYPSLAGSPILIAPDAVDLERYRKIPSPRTARSRLGLPVGRFTAGYFGTLVAGRGVEQILAMADRLPEVLFLLLGGEADAVSAWKERTAARENVRWMGQVPNADVPLYQAACDALLMPYQSQVTVQGKGNTADIMSPMKMYEYMAAGRLILASDLPALRTVLNERNSVLLPSDRIDAWVEALQRMRRRPIQARSLAARAQKDVQPLTWRNRVRAILDFSWDGELRVPPPIRAGAKRRAK
jgi:glycosyltransferase involved in cell wall biosynthesis